MERLARRDDLLPDLVDVEDHRSEADVQSRWFKDGFVATIQDGDIHHRIVVIVESDEDSPVLEMGERPKTEDATTQSFRELGCRDEVGVVRVPVKLHPHSRTGNEPRQRRHFSSRRV